MNIVHKGFDNLDIAFETHIPAAFAAELEKAKEAAGSIHQPQLVECGGQYMLVSDSGGKGGFAYRVDTGPDGATWFFKKPSSNKDQWGIRVSSKSLALALYGLGGVRARLFDFLEAIGAPYRPGMESIGRVDYCLDFLMPDFELVPDHFVMHSNATRTDNREMETSGRSGRVTGVRIGKMPGRQLVVYDKRAEVIAKKKAEWWEIWNANRRAEGLPPLNPSDKSSSQVWRVELRAGKRLLKDIWSISKWADFDNKLGDLMDWTLRSIRYTCPTADRNRARWPNDPLWDKVRHELQTDLFEMACNAEPTAVKEVIQAQQAEMLQGQLVGLGATYLSLLDLEDDRPTKLKQELHKTFNGALGDGKDHFYKKMEKAKERYIFISP
ncbi:hypothetical protein [Sneathiella sp.]|jgi:hypothetical protein|uniref:hypothetical protein n=1 Tax=Sneathiella sp. TaxID=1964365 RepID=UPI0039E25904